MSQVITPQISVSHISPEIFRAYDIRGIVDQTLTASTVYAIGRAFGSKAKFHGVSQIAIARDGRLSGPHLTIALKQGLLDSSCDVIDIGMAPTPLLYYAAYNLTAGSGIMLTGSHNPPQYNGLKLLLAGESLAENNIQKIYQRIVNRDYVEGQGNYCEKEVSDDYINEVCNIIKLSRPLKIVIDAGNGVAGAVATKLFRKLNCEVIELFCDVDGTFPNHHPDPTYPENLYDLISAVTENKADVGLAFDGDGDRLGVVTDNGKIIWPDRQLMLYAQDILQRNPAAEIIFDVKCTRHLAEFIKQNGGKPLMWKTGHSLIKAKMRETGALLAGEMSGHVFFKERWYGFDDGIYTAARLLEILSKNPQTSSAIFQVLPDSINTPELKLNVTEKQKWELLEKLKRQAQFPGAEVNTIDGLRVDFDNGWGLIRASNTTPNLVLRFEADTHAELLRIQNLFRQQLLAVDEKLVLPF